MSWRKSPPSQISLAQSTHFGITFSPTSSKFWRGRHVHIFFTGPRIGASDENVSPPTTGHQKGQNRSGVSIGKPFFPMFVWTGRLQVLKGMCVRKSFHANIRKSDLLMVNLMWNMTQKPDPTLEPSNYKQLPKIRMFSAENSICPRRFMRWTWTFAHMFYMYVHPETVPPRGALYFRRIYLVVRSTYAYVHTCLEEECRIINQSGSCTLRPLRLLYGCFPLNRRQISSDVTSSPLLATATKT